MKIIGTIGLLLLIPSLGCQRSEPIEKSQVFVEMRVTSTNMSNSVGCADLIKIQADGVTTAERGCPSKGKIEKRLSSEELESLRQAINKSNFFLLEDDAVPGSKLCPVHTTHAPTYILTINLDGKEKSVKHYGGCGGTAGAADSERISDALDGLYDLENKIDTLAGTENR